MAHPATAPPVSAASPLPGDRDLAARVLDAGRAAGLDVAGLASAGPFSSTRADLVDRRDRGLAADMQFTYRNPTRSTDPDRVVAGARALVVGVRAYPGPWAGDGYRATGAAGENGGEVAAYARVDAYAPLRRALRTVAAVLQAEGWRAVVVCDDNALVDRAAAHRAGLGWYGRNALFFVPGLGSRILLGSVVTDAPLLGPGRDGSPDPPREPHPHAAGCGRCTRCLSACPTGALLGPGEVDARRCLAWLVQAPGPFPVEHREALGGRLYGCDECQRVCPVNRSLDRVSDPGPQDPGEIDDARPVDLLDLLAASDDDLLARFGHWYVPRRDPTTIRRNVVIALGNVGNPVDGRVVDALRRVADTDGADADADDADADADADGDGFLAEHARWALARIEARAANGAGGPTRP